MVVTVTSGWSYLFLSTQHYLITIIKQISSESIELLRFFMGISCLECVFKSKLILSFV